MNVSCCTCEEWVSFGDVARQDEGGIMIRFKLIYVPTSELLVIDEIDCARSINKYL